MNLARWIIAFDLVGTVAFVGTYATKAAWWTSPMGRNLFALPIALGGLLALTLVDIVTRIPLWIWDSGLLALGLIVWWRVIILWRLLQSSGRDRLNGKKFRRKGK